LRAAPHPAEQRRLAALRAYGILDTSPEPAFDEIAQLAAALCGTPIAVVNLIDEARQWFKSEVGLGVRELPLADSICAHAILEHAFVEIHDTLADRRFVDNPLCRGDGGLRFYAGALLTTAENLPLGTLCVLDVVPRTLMPMQREALRVLGRQVMAQLELRRLLVAQQRLVEALTRADRHKDDFLAALSHELRSPLAPIAFAVAALERSGSQRGAASDALGIIRRQSNQMTRLVDDLLDTARIGQGKLRLDLAPCDVGAVIDRAIETAGPTIDAGRHGLDVARPAEPVEIEADSNRLTQVFTNLLINAARYTPAGGTITVSLDAQAGQVVARVSDTGIGIEPQDLERVFELFAQPGGDAARRGGLGVGLALVRRIVELHAGSVSASSAGAGRGACFEVRLPRSGAHPGRPLRRDADIDTGAHAPDRR
jgi:signal transduction histidine kinase